MLLAAVGRVGVAGFVLFAEVRGWLGGVVGLD